jgi:hypothetical protein
MIGLALGRLLSIAIDGWPSPLLSIYALLEIIMGLWGVLLLRRADKMPRHILSSLC